MKQLIWKLVLPLTIISFTLFTKKWYVQIDDYQEILRGFPFPFVCPGWHTSLSLQIFVIELVVDILVYFALWFFLILIITKRVRSLHIPRLVTIVLLATSGLFTAVMMLTAINTDNIYTTTRPFDIEILETEYGWMWQDKVRPEYDKYRK